MRQPHRPESELISAAEAELAHGTARARMLANVRQRIPGDHALSRESSLDQQRARPGEHVSIFLARAHVLTRGLTACPLTNRCRLLADAHGSLPDTCQLRLMTQGPAAVKSPVVLFVSKIRFAPSFSGKLAYRVLRTGKYAAASRPTRAPRTAMGTSARRQAEHSRCESLHARLDVLRSLAQVQRPGVNAHSGVPNGGNEVKRRHRP